ncbi:LacI family DNA-binding transcriptional regulator [Paenibacillus rubinfantis]|uniref:LacI family DNA-binding transcriptional regulator n=1 Tax=Paenibacillus rubinfantis TaxID=1720296 RepID=UPI00073F7664|nr:LacI family DNA-binding transcriptional regulator [Paenibacillus rubinfantis]
MNLKKIAELAGVSLATVSKVIHNYSDISEETRTKVLEVMRQNGYVPAHTAKALVQKQSPIIGIVFAGKRHADFAHPFFAEVLNAFQKQVGLLGYDLLFLNPDHESNGQADYLSRCREHQIAGCFIVSGQEVGTEIQALDQSEIPCIGIDLPLYGRSSGYLMSDHASMSAKAVEHFYLLGYRELGYIGSTLESEISSQRERGYRSALESYGLPLREEWFISGDSFYEASGYEAMIQLLQAGSLPRAIFAASDLLAIGAMRALREYGQHVPEEVAIIGCDDIEACRYVSPPLTTLRQNKEKLGRLAASLLFDLIHNQSEASSVVVEPELVVRASCGSRDV